MILHIVLFKSKPDAAPDAVARLDDALGQLVGRIPGLTEYSWGPNVSPEGKGQGYDLGFVMSFETAAARDAYLPHPEHTNVGPLVGAVADDVLVFDLEA